MTKSLSHQWYEAADKWVDLEAAASLLEETKSAILSQWMMEEGPMPTSKAEANVKASKRWQEHIGKICSARKAANKAKIQMEYFKLKFYENQSQEANHRLEAKL